MDSEARGIFQGSRCLPDKQCKCSSERLLFSNKGCKTMQASRQGACKHLSRQWLCSGFQQYIDEQFNSPEQLAKSALAYTAQPKPSSFFICCVSLAIDMVLLSLGLLGASSYSLRQFGNLCYFILSLWLTVGWPWEDSQNSPWLFALCNLTSPHPVSFSPSHPCKRLDEMKLYDTVRCVSVLEFCNLNASVPLLSNRNDSLNSIYRLVFCCHCGGFAGS